MKQTYKAALFDLDGVILDTESQYTVFWGQIGRLYRPDVPDFGNVIKGQTLTQIYDGWFDELKDEQPVITQRLNDFEDHMTYAYINGALDFIRRLHREGLPTAIVTSSNKPKMENVYRACPELRDLFTKILTSEDFAASKPDPDCYLKAAAALGVDINDCVVFEDSINGLKAGRASGAYVIALATTNPRNAITALADEVIQDFEELKA